MKTVVLLAALMAWPLWAAPNVGPCADALNNQLLPEQIFYREYGDKNAPPLVLIHGLGGSSRSFQPILKPLSEHFRVILYDARGHGRTEQKGWDYGLDTMAGDLKVLLDHLKIEKAHLLGLSFGARTGMHFTHKYPERVLSFLVEDMEMIPRVVDYKEEYLHKAKIAERFPLIYESREAIYELLQLVYPEIEAKEVALFSTEDLQDGRIRLLHRPHANFLFDIGANGADLTEALKSVKCPLLFVRADPEKSFLFEKGVRHIRQHRPDVPILTVEGADHVIHGSHPKTFAKIALQFFRGEKSERP